MKYKAEVVKQECYGDEAKITFGNVQRATAPEWLECGNSISINIPLSKVKSYPIGRTATIEIKAK